MARIHVMFSLFLTLLYHIIIFIITIIFHSLCLYADDNVLWLTTRLTPPHPIIILNMKKNCLFCVHNFICWLSLCWKSSTLRWQQKKAEFKAFTCYDRDLLKSNFHYHSTKCLPSISYCYYYCLLSSLFVDFVVFTWII